MLMPLRRAAIPLALMLSMVFSSYTPVLAVVTETQNITEPGVGNTEVIYNQESSFGVTIPKKITLDTDWFYRKPLKYGILYLSKFVDDTRLAVGSCVSIVVEKGKYYLQDHYNLLNDLFGLSRPEYDGIEDDSVLSKPIGIMLTITSIFFVIVLVYIFLKI